MGSLYKNGRVRSYIMIFLVLLALLISAPVKKIINSGVNQKVSGFSKFLRDNIGLSISYESLSPSLLSNFYIRNIRVFDSEENLILIIEKTKVNYSLLNIFRGNFQKGISSIIIDGVNIDVDILVDLIKKIKFENKLLFDLKQIKSQIPGNIKIKNVNLEYADDAMDLILGVKSVSLNNPNNKNIIEVQSAVNVSGRFQSISRTISGKMELSGAVTEVLDDSQLNIKFRDITDGDIKLNKLNLHASYQNKKIEVHTVKAVNPVSLGCFYDFDSGDLNLQIRADELRPVSVITANSRQSLIKKFKNFKLNTDTIVRCNVKERTLNFISDTHAFVPNEVVPHGLDVSFSVFGDERKAELSDFTINNQRCSLNSKLSFIYETTQLSGYIYVPQIILDNGNVISTELYFDPLEKGFMAFSPQLFIGDRSLTALQLIVLPQNDSYDFTFEVYDYSHLEEIEPGILKLSGSYLNQSKYFQTNISMSSIYVDSIACIAGQFLPEKISSVIERTKEKLASYVLSGDAYASTDLKTFSYNVPYIILANAQKDNQALMVEFNGTDKNIQLDQLSFVFGRYALEASVSLDSAPDSSDLFFTADINADSIPYHFSGNIMPELFTITGDYGSGLEVHFGNKNSLSGRFNLQNLPIKILDTSVIVTSAANFSYTAEDGPSIQIENLELEEADSSITVNPKIVLSGNASRYGANFSSIAYTDLYSVLQGSADVLLNINEGVFDSAGVILNLRNPVTEEGIAIDGSFSNPEHLILSADNVIKNMYMNFQIQMKNFSLNRFVLQKNDNNLISGMMFASGTLEHPYLALNIDSFGILCAANMLRGNGNLVIEDRNISINGINIDYTDIKVENIQAEASLTDMTLEATAELNIGSMGKNISAPLKLSVGNAIVPEGKMIPDYLTATLTADEFSGSLLKKHFPASISILYANNYVTISSSDNIGLTGTYTKDGILELNLDNKRFLSGNISGLLNMESMNLELYDFEMNMPEAFKYLNVDKLAVMESGMLRADFVLTGNLDDPNINGLVTVTSPSAKLPMLTKQTVSTPEINIYAVNNELRMDETIFSAKNNQRVVIDFTLLLNKWNLDHFEGNLRTYKNDQFHINFKTSDISIAGNITADINMYLENNVLELSGKVEGENVDASARLFGLSNLSSSADNSENGLMLITDLDIMLGTHASVQLEPIIRCVFVPNTSIKININQPADSYNINGALNLKSGDLAYLSRNFYIKSGAIKFNQNDISNPIITLNAETREKDENGQTVKILLSVEEQFLRSLQPKFSSVPPKSENEIKTLLGQIVIGDTENAADLIFVASDYALQTTLVRQAENKLRDLLNFDIFSLRTNFLQNTYNLSLSRNLTNGNLSIGNFLDNTTVYIGKYLGSFLYVDAMLHITLEQDKIKTINKSTSGTMLFQPEIGMELESPFANVRVNMTPDINSLLKNQFVPSTSVTLSWKFTY